MIAYAHYDSYLSKFIEQINLLIKCLNIGEVVIVTTLSSVIDDANFIDLINIRTKKIVKHDNKGWEFGGYQKGLDELKIKIQKNDMLFVVNDTTGIHSFLSKSMLDKLFSLSKNNSNQTKPLMIGEVDVADIKMNLKICGMDSKRWVRSCLFCMNYSALETLNWNIFNPLFLEKIVFDEKSLLNMISVSNSEMNAYVNSWIFGINNNKSWYASDGRTDTKKSEFYSSKAASILNEKFNSAAIECKKGSILSITPLSGYRRILFRLLRKFNAVKNSR